MGKKRLIPCVPHPGRVVAHRGASEAAPENTLAAFRLAKMQGADWVEFDQSLLGDGTAVVHHDAVLGRTARHAGFGDVPLVELEARDLPAIDAGGWFSEAFAGEPLPRLGTALDYLEALGLYANLEIKPHGQPEKAASATVDALRTRPRLARRILVSSFDHGTLAVLRAALPDQPVAVLMEAPVEGWFDTVDRLAAQALHIDYRNLTARFAAEARRRDVVLRVYTVNDPVLIEPFWAEGLGGVITDHPPLFLAPGAMPGR